MISARPRSHTITWRGRVRDTALYAIVTYDWPVVRERLEARPAGM